MRRLGEIAVLLFLLPAAARAADAPEALLPASTQAYLRWDGIAAHRPAFAKTALGQMMQGDTGTFLTGLYAQTQDALGSVLTVEQLLGGVSPEQLQKLQADAAEATKLPPIIGEKGFLIAGELRALEPPQGRLLLIVPDVGAKAAPLFGAIRLAVGVAKAPFKEEKIDGRIVGHVAIDVLHLAWWSEGPHALVYFGTDAPKAVIEEMKDASKPRLPEHPLYRRVKGFDKFETHARAFVDAAAFVKLAAVRGKEMAQLLDDLGLNGLRSLVLYSGFDGEAQRDLAELDVPGPRKGLLKLLEPKPFAFGDVPALPPDVVSWSMTNFDAAAFYDISFQAVERVVAVVAPDELPKVKAFGPIAAATLGVDLRKELLTALGDKVVLYSTPSEGPLTLGQTVLVKVKDAKKALTALDQFVKSLAKLSGADVSLRKRTYRGTEVREVHVRQQGFFFVPTYAIHDGWLAVSFFPQPVHGFIARSAGMLERWQPSARVKDTLGQLPKEFVAISFSDPRPSLHQLLSLAPLIGGAVRSFQPEMTFEIGSIPNAQEATRTLFPNLSVTTDDGKTMRVDTRASFTLPVELTGIDSYGLFIVLSFAKLQF